MIANLMRSAAAAAAFAAALLATGPAPAQDHSEMYPRAALDADAARLERAVRNIYTIGLEPVLTASERGALSSLRFDFPNPISGDFALDFYAYADGGREVVTMPLLSLKALEDLTTTYAWVYSEGYSLGTLDLYYAMLRDEDPSRFPGGRYPAIMPALGVPADAYEHAPVDRLSLSLRNEAFAFILAHELGHIVLGHTHDADAAPAQIRADETAADRFALDLLGRTGTPPLGAALLLQAQAYSLPHRGQFASEAEWLSYLRERATHPVTPGRLRAMAGYMRDALARARPSEAGTWREIGGMLERVAGVLDDEELQRCMVQAAAAAEMDDLRPRRGSEADLFARACL